MATSQEKFSHGYEGKRRRRRRPRKEVAGPYRDQSSVPSIRRKARPEEHRKVPVLPEPSAQERREAAARAALGVPPLGSRRQRQRTRKQRQQAKWIAAALGRPKPTKQAAPKVPTLTQRDTANRPGYAPTKAEALAQPVLGDLEKLRKEGKIGKTTGQKIAERVFEYGPSVITFGPEIAAGTKALSAAIRGVEAGGVRVGGSSVIGRALKPVKATSADDVEAVARRVAQKAASRQASGVRAVAKRTARRVTRKEARADAAVARRVAGTPTRREVAAAAGAPLKAAKVGAAQTIPVVRGHEQALVESPGKTVKTTARAIPGLVTAPVGAAAGLATAGGRAVSAGLHEAGVPGFRAYSGGEIAAPVVELGKEQLDFAKQIAKVITADDPAEVQKAVEDELGFLLPIMLGLGTKAAVSKVSKGRITEAVRQLAERTREQFGREHGRHNGRTPRVFEVAGQRKREAARTARARGRINREVRARTRRVRAEAAKTKGSEVVREGVVRGGRVRRGNRDLKIRTGDLVPFVVAHDIPLDKPELALAEVKRIGRSYSDLPEGLHLAADELTERDAVRYIERNPEVLSDPALRRAEGEYRAQARYARENPELSPEHSERARYTPAATTRRIPLTQHRFPRSVRGIVRAEPTYGVEAKRVLRREAREDRVRAKQLQREARRTVRKAKERIPPAERQRLRAERAEAEATGAARVQVARRDRQILRKDKRYMEAVKANNAAARELRSARADYGNIARNKHLFPDSQIRERVQRLEAAKRKVKETRRSLEEAKADVVRRAEIEASKRARGEKASSLADLNRGPTGILRRLERSGGRTLQRAERERVVRSELDEARLAAARMRAESKRVAELATRKRRAAHEIDDAIEQEFVSEVRDRLRREGMSGEPEYVSTTASLGREQPARGVSGVKIPPVPGRSKFRKGTAVEYGIARVGLAHSLRKSVAEPVARRESYAALRGFLRDNEYRAGDKDEFTSEEARRLFEDGTLSRDRYALIPRQLYKRAYGKFDPEQVTAALKQALDAEEITPGRRYKIVRRAAAEEFFGQLSNAAVSPKMTAINRATSYLILGTSPAWAAMQVVAEYAQAAVAQPKLLNPAYVQKLIRAYNEIPPHKRQAADAWIGVTARELDTPGEMKLDLKTGDMQAAADAYSVMHRTALGRIIRSIPNSIRTFDRWKGGHIRRLVVAAKIDADLNRRGGRFLRGIRGLDEIIGRVSKELKDKPLSEQLAYMADHPELSHRYQSYLDDVMGNWSALTKNERLASQLVIFYPFMRMATRWTFYAFPKRHPIKAALLLYLGQQNATELRKLLGQDPSFWTAWATVPLRLGDGETELIPLSRIAPGTGPAAELLGNAATSGDLGIVSTQVLRALQPAAAAAITAATGVNPLTGEQEAAKGAAALAQLLTLAPAGRVANEYLTPVGEKPTEAALPVAGPLFGSTERQDALDKLFSVLGEKRTPVRAARTLAAPVIPRRVDYERDLNRLRKILDTISENDSDKREAVESAWAFEGGNRREVDRTLTQMENRYDRANEALDRLFRKYKIPYKAEEERGFQRLSEVRYGAKPPSARSTYGGRRPSVTPITSEGGSTYGGRAATPRREPRFYQDKRQGSTYGGVAIR